MKYKATILTFALITMAFCASAQTAKTWIIPPNVTTNQTLILPSNQIMEVLSLTLDSSSAIDITIEGHTLTFGTGGTAMIPQPMVVAGPATVVMRRNTSSRDGSLMTFRVVQLGADGQQASR